MIRNILGFFGYVKIPLEAVKLSVQQELIFETMIECESSEKGKEYLARFLKGQQVMTAFLRSGRLLNDS